MAAVHVNMNVYFRVTRRAAPLYAAPWAPLWSRAGQTNSGASWSAPVAAWIRPAGSSEVAERASLALFARRTAVLPRWSARVLRDAFSTLSPRRPAANECSTHRYAMYTDSPAALRCKTDPFQRSRLSDPEAPSSTSVTAEGAQTASVSHLYGTPRALPLRCGPAKLGYDPWYACHRLGLARNAPRGRGQCISRPGSHPSTAVAGGPSRDVLCTRCTRSHAVKRG